MSSRFAYLVTLLLGVLIAVGNVAPPAHGEDEKTQKDESVVDISSPLALSLKKTVRRVVLDVTVTDADGNYQVEIESASAILVFSFVGYLRK